MKQKAIWLGLVFICISCIKEVNFNVEDVPKWLVINSVLEANQPINVKVSGLQSILDTSILFIDNALVILDEEDDETDTLSYLSNGNYESTIYAKSGKAYHLTVKTEGYPTVFATDTVPYKTMIKWATKKESMTVDEDGTPHIDYTLSFDKQTGTTNFYELFFVDQWKHDSMYVIDYESIAAGIDPIILASGTTDYNFTTYLFNDASLSTVNYTLSMKMVHATSSGGEFKNPIVTIRDKAHAAVLRTGSRAYYEYRNSWEKHQHFKNDSIQSGDFIFVPLMGEPQDMYSNIENGLGIFVAFSQDFYLFNE
jgi:hypothetical protein